MRQYKQSQLDTVDTAELMGLEVSPPQGSLVLERIIVSSSTAAGPDPRGRSSYSPVRWLFQSVTGSTKHQKRMLFHYKQIFNGARKQELERSALGWSQTGATQRCDRKLKRVNK